MPDRRPSLAGQVVLVTGGSSGIAQAIALACASSGADVAITYRAERTGADDTIRGITGLGRRSATRALELSSEADIRALAPWMRDTSGRVDTWINNAGADILTGAAAALPPLQRLDLLLTVDLRGTIVASWEAVTLMQAQGHGSIINMSWDHVVSGMAGTNPQLFAAVKGGVLSFSKSLARSVAPAVRVNVIAPGWIETSFGEGVDEKVRLSVADSTPLKR